MLAEFWERYVRYLAAGDDTAAALGALQRAMQVHCRTKPAIHLFAARFQEQHGDVAAARASLELVTDTLATGNIRVSGCPATSCFAIKLLVFTLLRLLRF